MSNDKEDNLELVVLKTVTIDYELNLIKNLLDEEEISYVVKDRGVGGYMRVISGGSVYGTDILVAKSRLEESQTVLNKLVWDEK